MLDKVVSITAADPQRRGCLMINAISELKVMSQKIQLDLKKGLDAFRTLLRQYLQDVVAQATKPDKKLVDKLTANLAASAIGVRVLGALAPADNNCKRLPMVGYYWFPGCSTNCC